MLVAMFLFSSMDATAKHLMEHSATSIQILALRSVFIVPCLLVFYFYRGAIHELKPTRPIAQCLRGIVGFLAPFCFFLGIQYLPLSSAVVVFFSSIFFTTLMSIVFLNEKVGLHRWVAVVVGYCGVAIAMLPWGGGELKGYLLILVSSVVYSALFISGKYLAKTESVSSLVIFYNGGVGLVALILLPWHWQSLSLTLYFWVLLLAILSMLGHFVFTKAFSVAEASQITPFEYTGVLWAVLFDIAIWHVYPSQFTLLGAMIIIGSSLYVIRREQVQLRRNTVS